MNYQDFRSNLVSVIDNFLADMDAVHGDGSLTQGQKMDAFAAVAARHEITLDEAITG